MHKNSDIKVLWLAPNFNHYKARFLNHLARDPEMALTILSGSGRQGVGDQELHDVWDFNHVRVDVSKQQFGTSKRVRKILKQHFNDFDWILIPAEKKNILLIGYAFWLRLKNKRTKLVSYNHPILKSGKGKVSWMDHLLTKFFYQSFDRIIFYTESSHQWAIENGLIHPEKAYWANNTIDTIEIAKNYTFVRPEKQVKTILFIGRLIASKRLDVLFSYFMQLQELLPDDQLTLEIIGDGPEKEMVRKFSDEYSNIVWHGSLIDESKIAPIMSRAHVVFIPGHSGLSVNHAFAYGRPYVTLEGPSHAPEISYIEEGLNGFILQGSANDNIKKLASLLSDDATLERLCLEAYKSGEALSVTHWVEQMVNGFKNE